jgi:hypothetical protein
MITFNVYSAIFLSLATSCLAMSAFFLSQEIGEVNRKLPSDTQISYWGIHPAKMERIKDEYKRLYPSGKIDRMRVLFQLAGFGFLVPLLFTMGGFK